MTGREAVMKSRLDVQQLVERIAIRQPRRAFLFGGEQIAVAVEGQRTSKARAGADRFALREIRRDALDGAVLSRELEVRLTGRRVDEVAVGVVLCAESKINRAVLRVHGDTDGIDTLRDFLPALCNDDFLVGHAIAILVEQERHLALARDNHAVAAGIILRQQRHADGAAQHRLVPEHGGLVLASVAVAVGDEVDAPVVTERDEFAIVTVADAGEVPHLQRQFLDREAGHEHLHDRCVLERFEGMAAAAGGEGIERGGAREQCLLDLRALGVGERAFIDEHRRDVAVEGTLRVRRLGRVVRVDAPADDQFIETDGRGFPLAVAELDAVEEQLIAFRADGGAHGEDVEILERQVGGEVLPRLNEVLEAQAAGRLDIQPAQFLRRRRTLIEIKAAGEIILSGDGAGEHPGERTCVPARRGEHKYRQFARAPTRTRDAQEIILAVKAHERLRVIRAKDRTARRPRLRGEQGSTRRIQPAIQRTPVRHRRQLGRLAERGLPHGVEMQPKPVFHRPFRRRAQRSDEQEREVKSGFHGVRMLLPRRTFKLSDDLYRRARQHRRG